MRQREVRLPRERRERKRSKRWQKNLNPGRPRGNPESMQVQQRGI